jgi:hypothetical protein
MAKKQDELGEFIETLTDAVVDSYMTDPTRAGLSISHIQQGYYCSVVRYRERMGVGKFIVCSATAPTLLDAVVQCSAAFLSLKTAKDRLNAMTLDRPVL